MQIGAAAINVIINPGSRLDPALPNTYSRAQQYAREWLGRMRRDGIGDVELIDNCEECDGRWRFWFRHLVTNVSVALDHHGVEEAAVEKLVFGLRVYWNGSSCANPALEDFTAAGYIMTYREESPGSKLANRAEQPDGLWCPVHRNFHPSPVCDPG